MIKKTVILTNEQGLHARPAQLLSAAAMKCKSDITMLKNDDESNVYTPKSILSIMSMGAMKGDKVTLIADGADEESSINTLVELIENGFDE